MAQMTKTEILNETVAFYSADPQKLRSYNGTACVYNGENGTHCAIGRCLLKELRDRGHELIGNFTDFVDLYERNGATSLDDILEEKYRGHDEDFWAELQSLHDNKTYWDASGITYEGELRTNEILSKIYTADETN